MSKIVGSIHSFSRSQSGTARTNDVRPRGAIDK
jgi:hypothetical protein